MLSCKSAVTSDAEGTAEPSGACSAGPVLWTTRNESEDSGFPATLLLALLPPPQGPEARTDCTVSGLPPREHAPIRQSQIGRSSPVVFGNSAKLDRGHSLVHGSFSIEVLSWLGL